MANTPKELTPKDLEEIEHMAGLGMRFEDIAKIKGMSDDTLKKYAKTQLEKGKAQAKAKVMSTAYDMAISGKHPAMTCFWLKTQAGWRETQPINLEVTGLKEQIKISNNPTQIIIAYLAETLEQIKAGDLPPAVASSLASVTNTCIKAIEQGSIEERLSLLETINTNKVDEPIEMEIC